LLPLTSGDRKSKLTELDERRLTLCHAKVGGTKALVSLLAKSVGGRVFPGFAPMSGWCGHEFESYSQPLLVSYRETD